MKLPTRTRAAVCLSGAMLLLGCGRGPARPGSSAARLPAASAGPTAAVPLRGVQPQTGLPPPSAVVAASAAPETAPVLPALDAGSERTVSSRTGIVVTSEPNATRAGIVALEHGGNAADAIVAAAFTLAVTYPSAGNLGGGGILLYRAKGGPTIVVEFREKAPRAVTQPAFDRMIAARAVGPAAVGVPGSVAGLNLILDRFGRLGRKEALARAIELAQDGFVLEHSQAMTLKWAWPALAQDAAARRTFGTGKNPKTEGTKLVQPELAKTLELIREHGNDGFYAGETAERIAALSARGGLVSREDLAAYRAVVREPLRTTYRGFGIETAPPPSAGGVALAATLRILEKLDARRFEALSADALHLFAEAARRTQTLRRFEVVDPDSVAGYDLAKHEAEWLDPDRVLARLGQIDLARATPSRKVHPLYDVAIKELEHTTHLAAVDADGNVASFTTTLSASFGAKVMAAGVVLNNSLAAFGTAGEATPLPERRTPTSMSPTLVLSGGEPVLVLGTPGGDTIPNTVAQVLRNVVDYGMTLDRAVDAPRVHHGFVPDEIRFEGGHPPPRAVLGELRKRGHHLSSKTHAIGDANSIAISSGTAYGYADPRGGGLAARAVPSKDVDHSTSRVTGGGAGAPPTH